MSEDTYKVGDRIKVVGDGGYHEDTFDPEEDYYGTVTKAPDYPGGSLYTVKMDEPFGDTVDRTALLFENEMTPVLDDGALQPRTLTVGNLTITVSGVDAGMVIDGPVTSVLSSQYKNLDQWAAEVKEVNELNGWFDIDRPFSADIALLHSEVSEAYEGARNNDWANVHEELADVFIRLMDTCARYDVDLSSEVQNKLDANRERGYRHGGKVE